MKLQGYCDVFLRITLKQTSTEARVYIRRHQGAKFEHIDVINVIYQKFSHGAVSYTLNGEKRSIHVRIGFSPELIGSTGFVASRLSYHPLTISNEKELSLNIISAIPLNPF